MRWGIIPAWWSKPLKEANKLATFNARAETIATKPFFRDSFRRRRCLMPVSGYYEWHDAPGGKQPYYFTRTDGEVMTIGAIQDGWVDPATHEAVRSCHGDYQAERLRGRSPRPYAGDPRSGRFRAMRARRCQRRGGAYEAGARGHVAEVAGLETRQ
jgi:hypothetical protein